MQVRKILQAYGIKPRKKMGQNFLVSYKYLNKIVESAHLRAEDWVMEIGAGIGNLTELLLSKTSRVIAIERDERLVNVLIHRLGNNPNLEILKGDFLKVKIKDFYSPRLKIIGNPPYYLASKLIEKLISEQKYFNSAFLSFQKEYVERMVANPGGKQYGRLSVFVQSFFNCQILFKIPKTVFYPQPEVDSIFISLIPKKDISVDVEKLEIITREFFSNRRKKISTIIKNSEKLSLGDMERILDRVGVNEDLRPEIISVENYIKIANFLREKERGGEYASRTF